MLRIYGCITQQHDLKLVVLAGLICLFACYTGLDLLARARDASRRRSLVWSFAAAIVTGSGVWATHFVAELAYDPGIPVSYDIGLTALSFAVAVILSWVGMAIVLRWNARLLGGGILGAAIGAMHYTGMAALRAPAHLHWEAGYVVASVAIGIVLAAVAMRVLSPGATLRRRAAAAFALVLAIVGLHFAGMTAVVLVPDPLVAVSQAVVDPSVLAVAVAAVTVMIVLLGISGMMVDNKLAWQAAHEAARLRESEARLRHSERHLARAQALAEIGSFEWSQASGKVTWSDTLYEIYGVDKERFVISRENILALVHPEDRERLAQADRDWLMGRAASTFEYRIVRPSGQVRHVIADRETIRDQSGVPVTLFGTLRDVTASKAAEEHRRSLEAQLQQAQRLEALGTLAGGVAHELNNTLVPVLALAKMTIKRLPEGSREQNNLITILRAGEKARDLVERIVAFSRKEMPVRVSVDLAELARQVIELLRASLPSTVVIEEILEGVPLLAGDPAQLSQIVINLVVNAVQALPDQTGTITVEVASAPGERLPQVPNRAPGQAVRLSVIDRGCGMSRQTLARIFEPFFTTKGVGEGTGLGLSVVHGIVAQHGGHIAVESELGRGTRFDVYLPVLSQEDEAPKLEAAAAA